MADGKKGFMLYADQKELFESLPDEIAGKLIKHIFKYVNDENPSEDDLLIKIAFTSIKTQLKRDLKKYKAKCLKNKDNINKRWNKKNTNVYERIPTDTKYTDKDNDKDNDKDIYKQFVHLKITKKENKKLLNLGYSQKQINDIYDSIENFKQNTKYKSLYLTAKNWLKKEEKSIKQISNLELAAKRTDEKFKNQ